ncbi:TPA: hypothetical protein NPP70_005101 [Klebsiella variicola subsp. variicola]|jgi:hypothetical protein|uniref:hypothetical protein n=1 Tax=Klebsiella variicola TaxID=244366 RepID=UPI0012DDA790|nr:hypothetical protein [Klebsiella variicola]HBZ7707462.1 hypothetical protein [Klebsiella variicola subsp. variicola]MUM48125.1 hypothetical protein [Klebsiella variicola]MUM53510.1 hypothetical protein [Klebsiella variicola]HCI5690883.1 hypothetical protein [Klebsiella variicola subsp. variicola]HCI6064535.1 hypothetical protein [Klebsiella variicola subsp. variicola]
MFETRFNMAFVALIIFVVLILCPLIFIHNNGYTWFATLIMMIVFCAAVGYAINGRFMGIVIDNRNRISLSKLQAAAWTILILSALLTFAMIRVRNGSVDALNIDVRPELMAVMGISLTSFVATPMILNAKINSTTNQQNNEQIAEQTAMKLNVSPGDIISTGKVFGYVSPDMASWLDIFRGDENSNASSADLGKIQQFLITAIVMVVYTGTVLNALESKEPGSLNVLPPISEKMAWLIGISHAGYLSYKTAPHGNDFALQTAGGQIPPSATSKDAAA